MHTDLPPLKNPLQPRAQIFLALLRLASYLSFYFLSRTEPSVTTFWYSVLG